MFSLNNWIFCVFLDIHVLCFSVCTIDRMVESPSPVNLKTMKLIFVAMHTALRIKRKDWLAWNRNKWACLPLYSELAFLFSSENLNVLYPSTNNVCEALYRYFSFGLDLELVFLMPWVIFFSDWLKF